MEQILAFILGVSVVTFIWVVVITFKTASKVRELEKGILGTQDWINQNDQLVNRRIDQEIDRVDQTHRGCIRYIDSRINKLEVKISEVDIDGCKPTKKILKG